MAPGPAPWGSLLKRLPRGERATAAGYLRGGGGSTLSRPRDGETARQAKHELNFQQAHEAPWGGVAMASHVHPTQACTQGAARPPLPCPRPACSHPQPFSLLSSQTSLRSGCSEASESGLMKQLNSPCSCSALDSRAAAAGKVLSGVAGAGPDGRPLRDVLGISVQPSGALPRLPVSAP